MQLVKDTGLDVAVEEARQLTADDGSDPRLWTSWGAAGAQGSSRSTKFHDHG